MRCPSGVERILYEIALLETDCRKLLRDAFFAESDAALTMARQTESELASGGPARLSYRNALF